MKFGGAELLGNRGAFSILSRPRFTGDGLGWLPAILDGPAGRALALHRTTDAGRTWREISLFDS